MAAKKNKYDAAHLRNLARYSAQVDAIYRALTKEAAAIASGIDAEIPEDLFSFADYPKTMKRVDALIEAYKADMMKVVVNGVKSEWTLANNKNNEIARQVFGDKAGRLTPEQERRYYKNNDTARQAFLDRKERGLNLSDRVWDYSGKFRKEIEMGVDLCLRKGMPAAEMARELQKYLKHPDELFRRVRDEHGILKLSQAAKDFHPGRGVYRSSYKNALRLAITETNMAYRIANWESWQTMDFVVGIRIQLSNNHTCLGADGEPHKFHDICDELAGDYPKSFKWVGWHPQCRCNAVPILKTVDEKIADNRAKRNGGKASTESVNSVKRMPKAFNEWMERNRDRIASAKSQPYFIRDNATAVAKIIPGVLPENMVPATPVIPIAERARMRHEARTAEQIADIRRRWIKREAEIRHAARTPEQVEAIKNAWNERRISGMILEMPLNLTHDEKIAIAKNNIEIEKAIGISKGKPMSIDEADKQNANPNYDKSDEYQTNCQTCVPAYNLRLRGFGITAKPNTKGSTLEYLSDGDNTWKMWKNQDGTQAQHTSTRLWKEIKGYTKMNEKRYLEFFNEACKEVGVYELCIGWKKGNGHALILQRFENGELRYIDPQHDNSVGSGNEWKNIQYLAREGRANPHVSRGIMRIDNKLFDIRFIDIFSK